MSKEMDADTAQRFDELEKAILRRIHPKVAVLAVIMGWLGGISIGMRCAG